MPPDAKPRGIIVSAGSSHAGKTVTTLGLIAALRRRGLAVVAAKSGPDYIDPAFLGRAAGSNCLTLDPWAMSRDRIKALVARHLAQADVIIVEGAMGLLDGASGGVGSTAALAAVLQLPVVLVIDGSGTAQSAAAVAEGIAQLAPDLKIAGAIVSKIGSDRHAALVAEGFARARVPLVGTIRRQHDMSLPSRHLGLVQAAEQDRIEHLIAGAADAVAAGIDLDLLLDRSGKPDVTGCGGGKPVSPPGQTIAIAEDVAFSFSYTHLVSGWRDAGATIVPFSPLADDAPPAGCDFVYLPGGYPELHAGALGAATRFRAGLRTLAGRGVSIYGECGGYMVLGEALVDAKGQAHEMAGLLPLVSSFAERRLHLGYRQLTPQKGAPFAGSLAGHEFHYATVVRSGPADPLWHMRSAEGAELGAAGLVRGSVAGGFAHIIDGI